MKITLAEGRRMVQGFPEAFQNKHTAILGTTGAGKTSVAKVAIVEPLLIAKKRVHIIDPKTDWWGLRLMADGKRKAAKIYIFGGERGDYPLRVADVPAITEAFARSSDSAIFDTKGMMVEERMNFFIKYAETILRKNKGPLNIVIDEAHIFLPQAGAKIAGLAPRMLHAGNEMIGSGRSQGLRVALLSQRPQKLHKDSLTLVQTLIAMRMFHKLDRDSITDWMKEQADPETGKEVMGSLSSLKDGEAWAWAPVDKFLERIQFPMPLTFDSSKDPEEGDEDVPALEPINIEDLTGKLGKIEEERKANDPKLLQAKIRELEKGMPAITAGEIDAAYRKGIEEGRTAESTAFKAGVIEGFSAGYKMGNDDGVGRVQDLVRTLEKDIADLALPTATVIANVRDRYLSQIGGFKYDPPQRFREGPTVGGAARETPQRAARMPERPVAPSRPSVSRPLPEPGGNGTISRAQQRIVDAIELWHALGHTAPTRAQVAAIAGYSPSSGGFNNLIGSLKTAGIIEIPAPGAVALVEIRGSRNIDLGEAGRIMLGRLSAPQRKLVEAMPLNKPMTRESLAEATEYSSGSGGFNNLIGSLNTLDIFRRTAPGQVALSDWAAEVLR